MPVRRVTHRQGGKVHGASASEGLFCSSILPIPLLTWAARMEAPKLPCAAQGQASGAAANT